MKISIITPSFNSSNFIEKNILSVLNQDYQNFEHLINDNNSTDDTHKILNKYKHLKTIIEKDEGQSDALNKMLNRLSGDIVGWLNADDFYMTNIFNDIANFFKNNPKIDALYGDYNLVNKDGIQTRKIKTLKYKSSLTPYICFIPSTTFFFRSELIKNNNIYFEKKYFYMMDKDFYCKISQKTKKIVKVNKIFANFRIHDQAKTAFNSNKKSKKNFYYEGIEILSNYSFIKFKKNLFGIFYYKIIIYFFNIMSFILKKINL